LEGVVRKKVKKKASTTTQVKKMPKRGPSQLKTFAEELIGGVAVRPGETPESYVDRVKTALRKNPKVKAALYYGSGQWGKRRPRDHDFMVVVDGNKPEVEYSPIDVKGPDGHVLAKITPIVMTEAHLREEEKVGRGFGHLSAFAFSPRQVLKGQKTIDTHVRRVFHNSLPHLVYYGIVPRNLEVRRGYEGRAVSDTALRYFGIAGKGYWRSKPGLEFDPYHLRRSVYRGWADRADAFRDVGTANAQPFFRALEEAGFIRKQTPEGFRYVAPKEMKTARLPRVQALFRGQSAAMLRRTGAARGFNNLIGILWREARPKKVRPR